MPLHHRGATQLRFSAILLFATGLVLGCASDETETAPEPDAGTVEDAGLEPDAGPLDPLTEAGFPLSVNASTGTFTLGPLTGYAGGGGAYAAPFTSRNAEAVVRFLLGFYTFAEDDAQWTAHRASGSTELSADGAELSIEVIGEGTIALTVTAPEGQNRVSLAFECPSDERFFGFGGQSPRLEHRGYRVPIWIQEQGLSKTEEKREDQFDLTFAGAPYDQYYGVPFFISPRGYGALVDQNERTVFELCTETSKAWRVETWSNSMRLVLFSGPEPTTVLERATAYWGRPPNVVDWALLPWMAIKGGGDHVREQVAELVKAGIAMSAIWSEDWLGESINPITGFNIKYHWEWDPEQYPKLTELIDDLHAMDVRFLGYFNPFVVDKFSEWTEAVDNGYLPKKPDGDDYKFTVLAQEGSVVDLTNEAARSWLLAHLQAARELGLDGWMADYAEWVPYDAQFADGRTGATVSSDYPRLWQQVNREACDPADCVFFVRSGFTGSGSLAPVAWGGDQNTDFGEDDGLPTAIRIGVGLGLTGVALYGSDIAGYTSFGVPPSTKELFWRWTTAGAFQPVMRTHEGNAGAEANWQWDKDDETVIHFARYAALHTRLFPFFKSLLIEATQTGLPVMRHPFLHYPSDAGMLATRDTYLLGDSLYVAAVVEAGATSREVTLPPGMWADWESGTRHSGTITAQAAVSEIPVFAKEGALIVMLPAEVKRTAEARAFYDTHLAVRVYPGADGSFVLGDGTTLTLKSTSSADPGDGGFVSCASDEQRNCQTVDDNQRTFRLEGQSLSVGDLNFDASDSRTWDVVVISAQ
ncbi:MAG: alpha-glucosidase [Myxococcota bacterium]|jgi:alpha-glucosidase